MSEREVFVEKNWADPEDGFQVFDDDKWLASFLNKEDAEEYADRKRLEP